MENVSPDNTQKNKGVGSFILIVVGFLAIIIALKFLIDLIM